ncbi:hypothetical protein DPM19_26340 [Actinomadura craniellae]|uniref:DUF6891 domain-containing protein n=1 Tax=Actinomadura craniellae TaxID=2231787 RepID=A0A365GZH8_9ACTN|nr:hypothetical protein [Actinomadura craniellae]RAY12239.1 hypothetical protein DPM19_26340 [Actinomadura craniellae]
MPRKAGTSAALLRAHATSLDEEHDDIDFLIDELSDHAEEHDLDVTEEEIATIAAETVLEAQATLLLATGYLDGDEIVDDLVDIVEDSDVEYGEDGIERIVERLWQVRLEEQRTWPETTDNDRLARAFARLRESGIVAEENFTCCQTCGLAEIGGQVPEGAVMDGYTYFHQQDTEGAAAGGTLLLAYGVFASAQDEDGATAVGARVVAALHTEGLRTEWNGSSAQRITVLMDWRRRLPT